MCREFYVTILLLQYNILSAWLSPYKVQLKDHEDFVISANASLSDDDEEEILQGYERASLNVHPDNSKSELQQSENLASSKGTIKSPVPEESQDMEDISLNIWKRAVQPTTNKEGSNLSHNTTDHVNKHSTNKSNQDRNEQTDEIPEIISQSSTLSAPTQYDYDGLRDDYYNDLQKELHSNKSFNYTKHGKFEKTIEDAINEIFGITTTKNCSQEEYSNFGIKSMKCSWDSFKISRTKPDKIRFLKELMTILALWLLICAVIATACVCQFGLCCCCCCCYCNFCQPIKLINKAKMYIAMNPPGVLVEGGIEKHHEPTAEEMQAYRELLRHTQTL